MKIETTYIADDGKRFANQEECKEYEKQQKEQKRKAIQQTMCDLDEKIWSHFYPNFKSEDSPSLHTAGIWLRNDIVSVLSDTKIDMEIAKNTILSMINDTKYATDILDHEVKMVFIMKEVEVRRDFLSALKNVKDGSDLTSIIGYSLGDNDIKQLALLHKSNKCRRKIEDLLTACNFHYECGTFANKDYAEFFSVE